MAEANKGPKQDELVAKLVKDAQAPPDVLLLSGFVGTSSEEGHTRLYFDPQLSDYVEIPNDAILHAQEVAKDQSPLGGTLLWIKKDAVLVHGKVGPNRPKAKFLEGRIQQEFLKGRAAAAAQPQPIGGNPLTQLGAGCPTSSPLVCTVQGETCPTTDGACTVVGLNCPTQQVFCTSIGPGCQVFTPPPLTFNPPCTVAPQCPPPKTHHFACTIAGECVITPHCPVLSAFCPHTVLSTGCHVTVTPACQVITAHCPVLTAIGCPVPTANCPLGGIEGVAQGGFAAQQAAVPLALTLTTPCNIHTEACPLTALGCNTVNQPLCHPSVATPCVTQAQPACHPSLLAPCLTQNQPACGISIHTPCVTLSQPACHPSLLTPCITQSQPICHPSVAIPCATLNEPACHPSVLAPCVTHNVIACGPSVATPCATLANACHVTLPAFCQITQPALCPVATGPGCPQASLGCPQGGGVGPVAGGGGVAQAAVAGMQGAAFPALHITVGNVCVPLTLVGCPGHPTVAAHLCPLPTHPPQCPIHTLSFQCLQVTHVGCPFPTQFCPSALCPSGFCPSIACGQGGFGGGGIGGL
jgi:hypothetical protein